MIVKVKFEGEKPKVGQKLRAKNGKVRKGTGEKLIIGYRVPDLPAVLLKDDEIWMDTLVDTYLFTPSGTLIKKDN